MLMRSWQPLTEIETIRQQLDKAFDGLAAARHNSEAAWMPAVEFADAGDNFVLKAQLPGIDPKDVDIQVTPEAITANSTGCFPCPHTFKTTLCKQAEYKDGILTLTLPKVTEARNKVVKIDLAEITGTPATPALEQANQ
jgi:HSP20 family protein